MEVWCRYHIKNENIIQRAWLKVILIQYWMAISDFLEPL